MTNPCPRGADCDPPRRHFLAAIGGLVATVALLLPRVALGKKLAIKLDKLPALAKTGGWVAKKILGQPVLFVRVDNETVRAVDPTCTHKKCAVTFNPQDRRFHCGCHKSAYDLDGKVLGGPAPAPLRRYRAKLAKDRVLIEIPKTKP